MVGHSDSSGVESTNIPLSQSRADRVVYELVRDGVSRGVLRSRGVASLEPLRKEESEESRQYNRSVTFRVVTSSAAGSGAAASSANSAMSSTTRSARP